MKLTQSAAIIRHLARKLKLEGETEKEKAYADMMIEQLGDIRASLVGLCYNPQFSQELLADWVHATGSFASSQSLQSRLMTLER